MAKNTKYYIILMIIALIIGIIIVRFLAKDNLIKVTKVGKIQNIITCKIEEKNNNINNSIIEKDDSYISSRSIERNITSEIQENETVEINYKEEKVNEEVNDVDEEYIEMEKETITETKIDNKVIVQENKELELNNNLPQYFVGEEVVGKIEIPKTSVNMYILKNISISGMEVASCIYYSKGELNKCGIHLIGGHNCMNGKLFSNNSKLEIGDKIYITTIDGNKVEYTIYNKFITSSEDVSYLKRDAISSPEICLQSCTDDEQQVLIVQARK